MNKVKWLVLCVVAVICLTVSAPKAMAGVGVSIDIGAAPACPYGYYPDPPYACAPYGYYGPDWFNGGVFIGAGPWYHGSDHFRGHVDNRFDADHFRGQLPERGAKPDASKNIGKDFQGHDTHEEGHH